MSAQLFLCENLEGGVNGYMELWWRVFRKPQLIARLLGIETEQKIPPNTLLSHADVSAVTA